jgi:hypothetical protein
MIRACQSEVVLHLIEVGWHEVYDGLEFENVLAVDFNVSARCSVARKAREWALLANSANSVMGRQGEI